MSSRDAVLGPGDAPLGSVREGEHDPGFWASFGPGLLWAATAIGVSHLVQSTRAGADSGFSLVWIVLLALALKYPFFEYGPRYAAATGESLIEGYLRLGRWAVWTYLLITLSTAIVIQSAVTLFTAFIVARAIGFEGDIVWAGALVLAGCGLLLWIGRFRALDRTIKGVLVALALCTVLAVAFALPRAPAADFAPWPLAEGSGTIGFVFILALVGWMPSAVDISVWSSLWTLEKDRVSGIRTSVRRALLDFRIGYVGTSLIALAFLTLGATVMHVADESFSPEGAVFSMQLVDLYAATLGGWTRPILFVAILATMFSTTLTALDGFPRAIARSIQALREPSPRAQAPGVEGERAPARRQRDVGSGYWISLVALAVLTTVVFAFFAGDLTTMVDFATVVSFLTAPILGYLNLRAVTAGHMPEAHRPGSALRRLSYVGIALMGGTGLVFLGTILL